MNEFFAGLLENHAQLLFALGGLLLLIELTVLGLASPLFFLGVSCLITSGVVYFGYIAGWEQEMIAVATITAVLAALFWKPLKNFQNDSDGVDRSSDMIGRKVPSSSIITSVKGTINYSGIDWQARTTGDSEIANETLVEITSVDGNVMIVKPAQ